MLTYGPSGDPTTQDDIHTFLCIDTYLPEDPSQDTKLHCLYMAASGPASSKVNSSAAIHAAAGTSASNLYRPVSASAAWLCGSLNPGTKFKSCETLVAATGLSCYSLSLSVHALRVSEPSTSGAFPDRGAPQRTLLGDDDK